MAKSVDCRAVGMDCDWKGSAATADELLAKCAEHAATEHPTLVVTPEVRSALLAAFKEA